MDKSGETPHYGDLQHEQSTASLEREKVTIAWQQLAVEQDKAKSAKWAARLSGIPLVVVLLTIASGTWSFYKTARTQFETKVVEIVLQTKTPDEALARARGVAALFPDLLPHDFERRLQQFDPSRFAGTTSSEDYNAQMELVKLLADHPNGRKEIIETWSALFPNDTWIARLSYERKDKTAHHY